MLSPPIHLRPRAQSNPARPKGSSSNSNSSVGRSADPDVDRLGTATDPERKTNKLQRPRSRRASNFSSSSSSSAQPIHPSASPSSTTSTLPLPLTRPPRNPARVSLSSYASLPSYTPHSSSSRPSSSSGARDHKTLWDPSAAVSSSTSNLHSLSNLNPNSNSNSNSNPSSGTGSPLLHKFVRRHKSITTNVNGFAGGHVYRSGSGKGSEKAGIAVGLGTSMGITGAGSLLTRAGREERRERERGREKEKELEKERDKEKEKGKEKSQSHSHPHPHPTSSRRPATAASAMSHLSHKLNLSHESDSGSKRPPPPLSPPSLPLAAAMSHSPSSSSSSASSSAHLQPQPQPKNQNESASSSSSSSPHVVRTPSFSLSLSSLRSFSQPTSSSISVLTTRGGMYSSFDTGTGTQFSITSTSSQRHKPKSKSKETTASASSSAKKASSPNFSTLDRTILAELKHSLLARESQFVLKGPSFLGSSSLLGLGSWASGKGKGTCGKGGITNKGGSGIGNDRAGMSDGVRHHPFRKEVVPYPRSYERGVVDLDVWETSWCQQLCGSVTWHVFETPPTKVLDLGCGTGTWVIECARQWKDCHFVGLDIVPLQPDLQQVGAAHMASRITWIQTNFLEGLPFPNEEFDFVHIKRIAHAVPEDKWDYLFEEITRVMKPGAAFEMFEEDLYFPGKPRDADEDEDISASHTPEAAPPALSNGSPKSTQSPLLTSPVSDSSARSTPTPRTTMRATQRPEPILSTLPVRRNPSPKLLFHPPPLSRPMTAPASSSTTTTSKTRSRLPALSISTMVSSPSGAAVTETIAQGKINSPASHHATSSTGSGSDAAAPSIHRHHHHTSSPTTSTSTSSPFSPVALLPPIPSSNLVRTAPKAPVDPRDHTVLEMIYTEMHAARFINLAPLSLLASDLSTWFKDVRSHTPLIFTFPPPPTHPRPRSTQPRLETFFHVASDGDSGLSDPETSPVRANDFDRHQPTFFKTTNLEDSQATIRRPISSADEISDSRFVSLQSLVSGTTPYAYLDDTRFAGFSPSSKASFPSFAPSRASIQATLDMLPPSAPLGQPQDDETHDTNVATKASASLHPSPPTVASNSQSVEATPRIPKPAAPRPHFKNRLPNTTLQVDLRTLNLHQALRTSEVLACAEAMWEWVLEFQQQRLTRREIGRARSVSIGGEPLKLHTSLGGQTTDPVKNAIAELSRSEFDALLIQFNLDMRDRFALGSVLEERFAWSVIPMPATHDRELFDIACDKWDQYQRQQRLDQNAHHDHYQGHRQSQLFSDLPTAISHLPTISDTMTTQSGTALPAINFEDAHAGVPQGPLSRNNSRASTRVGLIDRPSRNPQRSHSYTSLVTDADLFEANKGDEVAHPSQFLCRTMRVFVAWKA